MKTFIYVSNTMCKYAQEQGYWYANKKAKRMDVRRFLENLTK